MWLKRLGVNGARVFLTSLWGSSLETFVGGSTKWGKSLSGASVTDLASFQAAVAELRSPNGHDPSPAAVALWTNPVRWSRFDTNWVTTDTSSPANEQEGNHNATLAAVAQTLPNPPLVVISCGLGSVRDGGVLDNATSAYWASHWEVYKHFYAFSRYVCVRDFLQREAGERGGPVRADTLSSLAETPAENLQAVNCICRYMQSSPGFCCFKCGC